MAYKNRGRPSPTACPGKKPTTYIRTIWRAFGTKTDVWHCELRRQIVRQIASDTKR
jgi:hypothetical protein